MGSGIPTGTPLAKDVLLGSWLVVAPYTTLLIAMKIIQQTYRTASHYEKWTHHVGAQLLGRRKIVTYPMVNYSWMSTNIG